jgi:flagellar hook-basal body complex protein FliE
MNMNIGGIDSSRIESMMAQLKAAASKPAAPTVGATGAAGVSGLGLGLGGIARPDAAGASTKVSFSDALKAQLDGVNKTQVDAEHLNERFAAGDDKVSLSDTMIAMQKASISFQATVQVRNKLVSAYHDIMNMQV